MKVLTIAGVGPGDPSLLTLAAVDAIQESTVVSYPVSTSCLLYTSPSPRD